jgi:hypothetical protein
VNDVLIEELANIVDEFPGEANQTRCFNHIISLVARSVVNVFDAPKKNGERGGGEFSKDEELLLKLAEGIEREEMVTRDMLGCDEDLDDDLDGWVDEVELLTAEEKAELEVSIVPVRLLIVKVSHRC